MASVPRNQGLRSVPRRRGLSCRELRVARTCCDEIWPCGGCIVYKGAEPGGQNGNSGLRVDTYTWKARIAPVLIALLPVPLVVYVWFPGSSVVARIATILGAPVLLLWLLSELGRDMGKRNEAKLWTSWGGAPTTQRLRFSTPDANAALVERRHRVLSELDPTLDLPTAQERQPIPRPPMTPTK